MINRLNLSSHVYRSARSGLAVRRSERRSRALTTPPRDSQWVEVQGVPRPWRFQAPHEAAARIAGALFHEIFSQGVYQRRGFEFPKDATILDIGANMGVFSLWAAREAPQGRIVAIEPTRTIDLLRHNMTLNAVTHVEPVRKAMGIDGQDVEILFYPTASPGSLQKGFHNPRFTISVRRLARTYLPFFPWLFRKSPFVMPSVDSAPGISIHQLLREHNLTHVDFMKMDCEGGEFIVFHDLRPGDLNPIQSMVVEFHEYRPDFDHRNIVAILEREGFHVEVERTWSLRLFRQGYIWAKR